MAGEEISGRGAGRRFWSWTRGWLFTTNHKRIGILYLWVTFLWFLFAGFDGMAIRAELITPEINLLEPDLYNGLFTVHGTQMLFLFAIPVFSAFGNIFIPPMVGARDMAFPKMNALSLWLVFFAGAILRIPLLARQFPTVGWTNYVPMSDITFSPDFGADWWIWAVMLETIAATVGGINFVVTIVRERRPELPWSRLRPFVWAMLATSLLAVVAGPFLIAALTFLFMDRIVGTAFLSAQLPHGTLLWQHLFWFYSHPATYIMILPGFGIIAEVIPAFAKKALYSYKAVLIGIWGTTVIAMLVFWHHMFQTGMEQSYSVFAMVATFLVVIPTGVLFFALLATMHGGRLTFATPMLFAVSVIALFTIGGVDGVYLAVVPIDVDLHATYWLVAHIHFVLFGGTLMSVYAAVYYWFPQMFGRRLDERMGKWHFWGTLVGALVTYLPMHVLGAQGMVRRFWEYDPSFTALNVASSVGAGLIGLAQFVFLVNVIRTLTRAPAATDTAWPEPPTKKADPRLTLKDSDAVPAEASD